MDRHILNSAVYMVKSWGEMQPQPLTNRIRHVIAVISEKRWADSQSTRETAD